MPPDAHKGWAQREIIKLLLTVIVGVATIIGTGIASPSIPVNFQGSVFDVRYLVVLSALYIVGYLTSRYIDNLERTTGLSILHRPRLEVKIQTSDPDGLRECIYSASRSLAKLSETVRADRTYKLGTYLEDRTPDRISMTLSFFQPDSSTGEPEKSAYCLILFEPLVLVLSCGFRGNKEPFDILERSMRSEFMFRNIALGKVLVERRPG